jgi:hypothetical protein
MDFLDALINGMISGLGMFIVMTILGTLTFFFLKPWITKTVSEIWATVKNAGVIEIKLDGKEEEHADKGKGKNKQ